MIYLNKCCKRKFKYKKRKCNGRDVILSAILFENGVSEIIASEGELLQKLIERNESPYKLIIVNRQIAKIVCCLKDFEEKIVWEIIKE
jgi:hypothetical protein